MGSSAEIAGLLAQNQAELLYESPQTRIQRVPLRDGSGSVIFKEPLDREASPRITHERDVLERLQGVEGIPRLWARAQPYSGLILEDDGSLPVPRPGPQEPMDLDDFIDFAPELATTLAEVHHLGVMHKDISPSNILQSAAPRRLLLIDFDLATTFAEEHPSFTHHNEIVGTLLYMAPEQTGRTGRPLDTRADLYGLGATFYEFLTGRPPFSKDDPLRLIHDHLAHVPIAPSNLRPDIPEMLSAIIMRLLEKEPDERYQSADGLAQDLDRVRQQRRSRKTTIFSLGEADFPLRLRAPSRLVGRSGPISVLDAAFRDVMAGMHRGILVTGSPGVGKTVLLDELRPLVTEAGGLFVSGKFDQYYRGKNSDAVVQVMRALTRMLMAESDSRLANLRERLLAQLGPNAGLIAALDINLRGLLKVEPEPATSYETALPVRMQRTAMSVLRAIASPQQPVVAVVDDLQWAGATPLNLINAVLTDSELTGVLVVGAYRTTEVGPTHPLSAMVERWSKTVPGLARIDLEDLPQEDLGEMLSQMLRMPVDQAGPLATAIGERTGGNPFDTVELLNALRRDTILVRTPQGWQWDAEEIRNHPGSGDVVSILTERLSSLPPSAGCMLDLLTCLGGEVPLERIGIAADMSAGDVQELLTPCLEDGLLILDPSKGLIRFRHDRVQQAAFGRLSLSQLTRIRLQAGRRFLATPGYEPFAAEHFLFVLDEMTDPQEKQRLVPLFRNAATAAMGLGDHLVAERYISAAINLVAPDLVVPPGADPELTRLMTLLASDHHSTLVNLGRLQEADNVFERILKLAADPFERSNAVWLQLSSLINRDRPGEAIQLGLGMLKDLGLVMPSDPTQIESETNEIMQTFAQWFDKTDLEHDLSRPEYDDRSVETIARTIDRIIAATFFVEHATMSWLVAQAVKVWMDHGPSASLLGPVGTFSLITDYTRGNRILRRVLEVGEARGYEPDTAKARFMYALSSAAWVEPVEESVRQAHRAREGLLQAGDLYFASHTYASSIPGLFDCAPDLDEVMTEIEASLVFCDKIGNEQSTQTFLAHRQLLRALRGKTSGRGSFDDGSYRESDVEKFARTNPVAYTTFHTLRALSATIMDDAPKLVHHAGIAAPMLPFIQGSYFSTLTHLVQLLALLHRTGTVEGMQSDQVTGELNEHLTWLRDRAEEQPDNFRHLLLLIEAEKASAGGEVLHAMQLYDQSLRAIADRRRPWHRAFVLERAGLLHLRADLPRTGQGLLAHSLTAYKHWGAEGKVDLLLEKFPELRAISTSLRAPWGQSASGSRSGSGPTIDTSHSGIAGMQIDLVGVLRASQEILSETDLDRLRQNVITILSALTGATSVRMILWSEDAQGWFVSSDTQDGGTLPLQTAAREGLVPLSLFRHAERTQSILVVQDAVRDVRFARDPHFLGMNRCSALVVPVLARGVLKAVLVLENRLSRAAFSDEGLEGVHLIAGQLAVALDNAMLNTSLERKVAERTEALGLANERLAELSHTDPLTGLANRRRLTEVLHSMWHSAAASHASLAALMIDIDHFKTYNDRYGHPAGDSCLQRVAACLTECVRSSDLVARYGGEEFIVLLHEISPGTTQVVAERIRKAVRALKQPHEESPFGIVTVSIGGCSLSPSPEASPDHLVEEADAQLYQAKRAGRDQTSIKS